MIPFIYESLPSRVIFGRGTVGQVSAEIERLGAKRVIILSTAEQSAEAEGSRNNCAALMVQRSMAL